MTLQKTLVSANTLPLQHNGGSNTLNKSPQIEIPSE